MNRKSNIINNVILMVITLALIVLITGVSNGRYSVSVGGVVVRFFLGAVISGFVCTLFHELGHLISGRKNGFAVISLTVWFFKWTKRKNKIRFDLVKLGDSLGNTETVSKTLDSLPKRLKKMTLLGSIAVIPAIIVGIIPLFIETPLMLYCILSMFLPIGAYVFLGNLLPMTNYGVRNDGALICGLNRNDDESKVMISYLSIQSEMYNGKSPSEIDEKLYFDIPQLQEDNIYFALMLDARYNYYLDKEDYENAKKTIDRLFDLEEYLPKQIMEIVKANALYNACTFDFNEERADDLTYEIEKYLNNNNDSLSVRAKLAYILYVKGERDNLDDFIKKGLREAKRCYLSGYGKYEKKLIEKIKKDV